jgi:hypothetical protein
MVKVVKKCYDAILKEVIFVGTNISTPFGSDAQEELEVYAGHRTRQHRKVFFVKQVVDVKLNGEIGKRKEQVFFDGNVAHKIGGQFACEGDIVARHGVSFAVITPFIQKREGFVRYFSRYIGRILRHIR